MRLVLAVAIRVAIASSTSLAECTIPAGSDAPVLIWNQRGNDGPQPCDVPCEYTSDGAEQAHADASVYTIPQPAAQTMDRLGRSQTVAGQPTILRQEEGEHYYPIEVERYAAESTYRWSSQIKNPYFQVPYYVGQLDIRNPPMGTRAIDGVTFLAKNCRSKNRREDVIRAFIHADVHVRTRVVVSSSKPRLRALCSHRHSHGALVFWRQQILRTSTTSVHSAPLVERPR